MKYLVIDGNSIINRAFYGIKLLNAKDGHFTNAIYGFFNILLGLDEKYHPDAIIAAFDVHKPTFRHEMYTEYKAGRKSPPPELLEQFEPLKTLLTAYGCKIIECPGFEADDILGTLSASINKEDHCYIATGDRDSLQLINDNVSVLLTTTKMGKTQTVEYNRELLFEEYGVEPSGMIELKALQGDNSDNIPGVAGIGPKTAGELIKKYKTIDAIYSDIDAVEATASVKAKLLAGKDSAFFSRTLGTICLEAPVNRDMNIYLTNTRDNAMLLRELARHEMFKVISRLGLSEEKSKALANNESTEISCIKFSVYDCESASDMLKNADRIYISPLFDGDFIAAVSFITNDEIIAVENNSLIFSGFIRKILESSCEKYTTDCKQLYYFCFDNGIEPQNITFDITLASYLLDVNSSDYSLPSLALSYNVKAATPDFSNNEAKIFCESNREYCESVFLTKVLADRLNSVIIEREQTDLLKNIEIPLSRVLVAMEREGMQVDTDGIRSFSEKLSSDISLLEKDIYSLAQEEFNINSPKQLGVILFEKMGLPAKKKTKTGYSTNAEVLEALAEEYPIVSKILEYRTLSKLRSTYCEGLLKSVDSDNRVRCTFNQTETRTGRLSSTEPNLQNIPVRTALGREMRKFFIARDGYVIIDADYSQIELRVLAALSGDKNMIDAFNSGVDIHTVTASKVFGVPPENVTGELRSKAKAVNFGIVYGIGSFSLAKDIKSTRAEADSFIKSYLALYSSVNNYLNNCIANAKETSYSVTYFKRRRYLPELSSSNGMLRAFGERVARNMPIQGTAADIIKIAMINVYERLKKECPEARLIMQVHDELMAEAPEKDAEKVAKIIKEEMENTVNLGVLFSADTAVGKSWYDAKD
ncbi:MAG: DNA polymerase I [Clostridia bacterium]|nr:DNA polymerase I [Clostridia bacterium]